MTGYPATRSPLFQRCVTDFPTSTISPENSWPMTLPEGSGMAEVASVICKSEPQMPQLRTLRTMSFGPQTGSGTVSITSGFEASLNTAARINVFLRGRRILWTLVVAGYVIRALKEPENGDEPLRNGTRDARQSEGQAGLRPRTPRCAYRAERQARQNSERSYRH